MDTITLTDTLPTPAEVQRRIDSAQDELRALRRLYTACVAAARAREARERRQLGGQEAAHA